MSPFPIANSKHQTNNYSSVPKTTGLLGHLKNQPKFVIQYEKEREKKRKEKKSFC